MITISEDQFKDFEQKYEGLTEQILRHEAAELPTCPHCGSADTAEVIGALIGRTIHLAAATTKVHLTPNGNGDGAYYCNACRTYFSTAPGNVDEKVAVSTTRIFTRPRDDSWQAYRGWVLGLTSSLTGKEAKDTYTEDEWKQFAAAFWAKGEKKN